jgi:hypothetical protein
MDYQKFKKAKAIESKNKFALLKVNKQLNDESGIYCLLRTDDKGIHYFYIGQSLHILTRLAQHMVGYQHIDVSIRKYGLYTEENPYGWKVAFINYPKERLDEMEQHWILEYTKRGYQCRYNKTSGSQGTGKEKINEFKPSKGYRDGLRQGKKALSRDLKAIIDKHLTIELKEAKKGNKTSQKALEKFMSLLDENTYKE